MKSIHITFINVFIIIIFHVIVFQFLHNWAMKAGGCGMGLALLGGYILLAINFLWSVSLIYFIAELIQKSHFKIISLFVVLGILGNFFMTLLLENYSWFLLIIPYLIFLGESIYIQFEYKERLGN